MWRAVTDAVGAEKRDALWAQPDLIPTSDDIDFPTLLIQRITGDDAVPDDIDQAITAANSLDVSFQAAVFTRSIETALRCYQRLDGSAVMLNDHTAFRADWMPFAGLRRSGLGVGGIPYTFRDMQIEKMCIIKEAAP